MENTINTTKIDYDLDKEIVPISQQITNISLNIENNIKNMTKEEIKASCAQLMFLVTQLGKNQELELDDNKKLNKALVQH